MAQPMQQKQKLLAKMKKDKIEKEKEKTVSDPDADRFMGVKKRMTLNEFKEFVDKRKPDLTISRVPEKALILFKNIAKEHYANDYGLFLKALLDYFVMDIKYQDMLERIMYIEELLDGADISDNKNEKKIKLLNKKEIKIKEEED